VTQEDIANVRSTYKSYLESQLSQVQSYAPTMSSAPMLQRQWKEMTWPPSSSKSNAQVPTGVDKDVLKAIGKASVWTPENFELHPKLTRHVKNRLSSLEREKGLDWATAEALAFGSLMQEGFDVRISGQDVGRGTFSHRHAMLVNQKTEGVVVPLNEALGAEGKLELANSALIFWIFPFFFLFTKGMLIF
jgi:probable 2-oxoglutarate dehydrogenase E1 component DHKTD1